MREQLHLMLDIETASSAPDAAVIAIGARLFTHAGVTKGFEVFIDSERAMRIGSVSPETMAWWGKQPAYELVFGGKIDPADAAFRFVQFVNEHHPETVWANSPSFDCVILRNMFKQTQMKFPFHYRDERDFRTMVALGRDLNIDTGDCWAELMAHSPLDDATGQARAMAKIIDAVFSNSAAGSSQGSAPVRRETLHLPAAAASPVAKRQKKSAPQDSSC